jgi:hypothetical protein
LMRSAWRTLDAADGPWRTPVDGQGQFDVGPSESA